MKSSYSLHIKLLLFAFALLIASGLNAQKFVVVLDAGHGGHDPGAIGKITKEKIINLNVALELGRLIEKNCPEVKVVYTRKKDVFIPLQKRADIANKAKADLFISIHTNSIGKNNTARGSSTWTLGLAKSSDNLEAAKRENSVILLEKDYEKTYAGFNPNVPETYIMFELMQDKYMKESVSFASMIQKHITKNTTLKNRGVHQDAFWVLKASAMPSVLIELGFISTPDEERYLASKKGVEQLAYSIYSAFLQYRDAHKHQKAEANIKPKAGSEAEVDNKKTQEKKAKQTNYANTSSQSEIVFKLQILTSDKVLSSTNKVFKGEKNISHYKEKGIYKYTCFESTDYNVVYKQLKNIRSKFPSAFIVAFQGKERIDINKAIRIFKNKK